MKTTMQNPKADLSFIRKLLPLFMSGFMIVMLNVLVISSFAQSPNAIPYQAVARNATGGLITGQLISLRFSIHNLSPSGTVVYAETQTATTNNLGLFSVNIGYGTPVTGTLIGVNWSSGAKFIQVELDAAGDTAYVDMGTTQLMSVPYALYAAKAGNLPNGTANGNTLRWNGSAWVANNTIFNNGTNVGVGTATPATKLDVAGTTKTTNFQMTNGGGAGKVLLSDATGNATWTDPTTISINESDPQVSSVSNNQIPKWNGTTLTDGIVTDNGTNVGIGTTTPAAKLDVAGTTKTSNLQMTTGAGAGKVLQSDSTGNATWVNSTTLSITEQDPKVGTLNINKVPKWNGTSLTDGVMYDNGTKVGIGTTSPMLPLTVRSAIVDTFENVASLANANGDQGFQLNTTRGDVTNTAGSIMTQIGQAYNGNRPTEAIRFHRGINSTTGSISVSTSGSERMRINSIGNVGIGTTTPRGIFDVQKHGDIYLSDSTNTGSNQKAYLPGNIFLAPYNETNISYIQAKREDSTGSSELQMNVVGNGITINAVRIDSAGNVGVGIINPKNKLDVEGGLAVGATYSGADIAPTNGAIIQGNVGIGTPSPVNKLDVEGGLAVGNAYSGSSVAPVNGAIIQGNVGIGTDVPIAPLDFGNTYANRKIVLNSSANNAHQYNGFGINSVSNASNMRYQVDSTAGNHIFYAGVNSTTSNELMRITGTGNVGIGTNAPAQKLDVNGTTRTTAFQMPTGAADNYVLKSDANGNASWVNLSTITVGETDPQVSSATTNQMPKWNGTTLTDGIITDNGTNVGVGTTTPASKLDVNGTVKATGLQLPTGAANNFVLKSDAIGNASWVNLSTITLSETDPQVSSATTNQMPKWNGTTLTDGIVTDNGTNVGVGTTTPATKLDVNGTVKATGLQLPTGAANNFVLKSDAIGNASWVNLSTITVTETDPQVNSVTTNQVPKWNGTTLTDGIVTDNGTNVGIGTASPASKLDVNGTVKATGLQLPTGAANNYVLKSDAGGNASWTNLSTISVPETDPKVGTLSTNKIPKWNGTTLADGQVTDNGTNVGIGTTAPTSKLHVKSNNSNTIPLEIEKSNSTNPLFTVTQGSGVGNGYVGVYDNTGVEGVRLHSANDSWFLGNLGIGTNTPRGVFDVQTHGNIYLADSTNSGSNQRLFAPGQVSLAPFNGTDISYIDARRENNSGNTELQFRTVNNGLIGSTMRLTNDGKVGIGTTTPSNKLDVNGTIRTNDIIISAGAASGKILTSDASGNASWQSPSASETDPQVGALNTSNVPRWNGSALSTGSITDNGSNVGIGTASPLNKLDVEGGMVVGPNYAGTYNAGGNNLLVEGKISVGTPSFWNGLNVATNMSVGSGYDVVSAPTNGAIIKGNVGIGTTSPANKLDIAGGLAVGSSYAGVSAAPTDGAIIMGNVGIGTSSPTTKLDVNGTSKTQSLQVTNGAVPGYFLKAADAAGNAQWAPASALINEQDPEVSSQITNYIPKWSGNSLVDGSIREDANGKISVGLAGAPNAQLTIVKNYTSNDVAHFFSDDINGYANIGIGRNYNVEARVGVAAVPGQYFNNSAGGDMIIRSENNTNKIMLGTDPTQDAELAIGGSYVGVAHHLGVGTGNIAPGLGFFPNPFSVLDVNTGSQNAWIHGNGNGNSNSTNGYPLLVSGGQNGIAVQVSNSSADNANNFMTFFDGNSNAKGAIEGQSYADLQNNWEYQWFWTHHALAAASAAASLVCAGIGSVMIDPGWICQTIVGAVEIAAEVADWVLYAQDLEQNYGITYKSGGADYAEWMPRTRLLETLSAGDIVGVKDGHISKSTVDADQLMVISTAPMVLGNVPEKNKEHEYNKVAFMGQVPVKVNGMVKSGDFILSSGYDDGYGYAKSEENMTATDFKHIVGIAWASKKTDGIGFVNTAVGINSNKLSGRMSRMQEENDALKNQVESIASYLKAKDPSFNLVLPAGTKAVEVKNVKANPEQDMTNAQIEFVNLIGEIKADPVKYTNIFKAVKEEMIKRGYNLDKVPEIRDMLSDANAYVKGLEKYQNLLNKHLAEMQSNQPNRK